MKKRSFVHAHIIVLQHAALFIIMLSLCLKIAANVAAILLLTAIGLVIFNLWREAQHLRELNRQILSLCQNSYLKEFINENEDFDEQ
jgi:hypothetical protein